jgi:hypothetical protein
MRIKRVLIIPAIVALGVAGTAMSSAAMFVHAPTHTHVALVPLTYHHA